MPAGLRDFLMPVWWVFEAIDDAADRLRIAPPSALLSSDERGGVGEDLRAELTLFGVSVGLHEILAARIAPAVLLGHSLGFLPALVGAKAFTVEDGCRVIHLRHQALRRNPPPAGGMVSIDVGLREATALASDVGGLTVACANTPTRTVLCGLDEPLAEACARARALDWPIFRLPVRHPYHGPHMARTLSPLRKQFNGIRQQPLRTPVFSATTRRFCADDDDLLADFIDAIAQPVWFSDAVRHLHARGVESFVECHPTPMLANLTRQCVPEAWALSCLDFAGSKAGSP